MSGRAREQNQARPVRCSANCGTLVWLKGALPVAADAEFVCAQCTAALAGEVAPTWHCHFCDWRGDGMPEALAHEDARHKGAALCTPIDEELDSYRALREATS